MNGFGDDAVFDPLGGPGPDGFGDDAQFDSGGGAGPWGFGDPPAFSALLVQFVTDLGKGEFPDNGGVVVTIGNVPGGGPYRVQLKETHSLQVYPQDRFGCWGCVPGDAWECWPTPLGQMSFALPPVPPGEYAIVVSWGGDFSLSVTLADTLTVLWRNRQEALWTARKHLPPHWTVPTGAGPRVRQAETLLGV